MGSSKAHFRPGLATSLATWALILSLFRLLLPDVAHSRVLPDLSATALRPLSSDLRQQAPLRKGL